MHWRHCLHCAETWVRTSFCQFSFVVLFMYCIFRSVRLVLVPRCWPVLGEVVVEQVALWAVQERCEAATVLRCSTGAVENGQGRCHWSGEQLSFVSNYDANRASPNGAIGSVTVHAAWLWWSVSLGSRPRLAGSFVSGYSSVCFEIKFSGRHRGFDGVVFKLTVG